MIDARIPVVAGLAWGIVAVGCGATPAPVEVTEPWTAGDERALDIEQAPVETPETPRSAVRSAAPDEPSARLSPAEPASPESLEPTSGHGIGLHVLSRSKSDETTRWVRPQTTRSPTR